MKITEHDRANGARLGRQSTGLPGGRALRGINARQDVRKYAAEQGISENEVLEKGLKEKSAEWSRAGMRRHRRASPLGRECGQRLSQFVEKGAEVYAKA
jgi:hypothetical protein